MMAIVRSTAHSARPRGKAKKTLATLVEDYLIAHQSQQHSPKTIEWHRTALRFLLRFLDQDGITDPLALETNHLRRWVVWMGTEASLELRPGRVSVRPRSKRTINTYARSVHAFCKWLCEEGHTSVDVTEHFALPKAGKPLIRILEEAEFARLLAACDQSQYPRAYMLRDQAILWVLYDTGIRVAELAGLTFKHLDLRDGVMLVHGKGDKERRVALGANAMGALRRYIDHARMDFPAAEISDRVFMGEAGPLTVRGVQLVILRLKRRSGLDNKRISAHIFRHTFAVRYLMLGGDPFSLQELLGHEDMATI